MARLVDGRVVTFSAAFLSKHSVSSRPADPPQDRETLRRCAISRRSLGMVELVLPAMALRNAVVARWARDHSVAVDVRDGRELAVAVGAGIHPIRMTAHGAGLTADELVFCAANLGVGRVVVNGPAQIDVLAATGRRGHRVLVSMGRGGLAAPVADCRRFELVGLYGEIGPDEHHFVSYPAAIGDMLLEMSQIRRTHGVVLTRIALGGCGLTFGAGPGHLSEVANAIDETLDDACATLRFPRPVVVVSAQPGSVRV
ncbi:MULTISPECIES: LysA protein [Mycolicibacterium]|uniref:LysA protein n=1 Tax=Mycolicibacterium TaxID=1866885 RepID=UPI000A155899|nr:MULTISPECIES: LysA protein [Mycolicibacterium]